MLNDSHITLVGISISTIAGSAAMSGWIAHVKRRPPLKGVLLGIFLGPLGVLFECWAPYVQRPMVDEKAFNSLRSMMVYQETGREFHRRTKQAEA